jgi:hypothetical protein
MFKFDGRIQDVSAAKGHEILHYGFNFLNIFLHPQIIINIILT